MALGTNASHAAARFGSLPITQQLGLLIGFAASIALSIWVVLWSQEPIYRPLFNNLSSSEAAEVVDVLHQNGFKYKINRDNGSIMINSDDIHDARMKLAQDGLPKGSGRGYEIFSNTSSFSTSQFMENARYLHAIETELARTISHFNNVKSARVHLAVPRQSSFVRKKRKPKGSVFLNVYGGMDVPKYTVTAIANIVASSIPNLTSADVTVVDQNGKLLNDGNGHTMMSMTDKFYDYRLEVERSYANKIQEILEPILGAGKIKAKVSVEMDFTSSEQTRELYNQDLPALRSEQTMMEKKAIGKEGPGVVVGAKANEPSQSVGIQNQNFNTNLDPVGESDIKRQSTKNYELDKTISHTQQRPGRIDRLTVAVLVDDKHTFNEKSGKVTVAPLTQKELDSIRVLVSDTIGLNLKRGDSLNVVNISFNKPQPIEPIPEPSIWGQSWFWVIVKQTLGGTFVLFIVFGVIRPLFTSLAASNIKLVQAAQEAMEKKETQQEEGLLDTAEAKLTAAKGFANGNPKGVAEVVKTWVDGG